MLLSFQKEEMKKIAKSEKDGQDSDATSAGETDHATTKKHQEGNISTVYILE